MTEPSERNVAAILARGLIRVREQARRTGVKRRPPAPVAREQLDAERTPPDSRHLPATKETAYEPRACGGDCSA